MAYGGESNAKRLARARFWIEALFARHGETVYTPECPNDEENALVLCGPEGADVRILVELGFSEDRIVAVDSSRDYIEYTRERYPAATCICGELSKVISQKRFRRHFHYMLLDFCSPISKRLGVSVARTAAFGLKHRGVLGAGFMYGREGPGCREHLARIRKRMSDPSSLVARLGGDAEQTLDAVAESVAAKYQGEKHLEVKKLALEYYSQNDLWGGVMTEMKKGRRPTTLAQLSRTHLMHEIISDAALQFGYILDEWAMHFYRSGRRVGKRSVGVPMMYYQAVCDRPNKSRKGLRRLRDLRIVQNLQDTMHRSSFIRDDPDGEVIKKAAVDLARMGGSARAAEILNLKRQQVAAWLAWETMRERENGR